MDVLIMSVIGLVTVVLVKRRQAFDLRWQPERGTWVAIGTGLLAFALSGSLLFIDRSTVLYRLVLYFGIWTICGIIMPWGYTLLVEKKPLSALGLKAEKLWLSLAVNLALGLLFLLMILAQTDAAAWDLSQVGRAAMVLVVCGGLFETFLFYGFIHLRLKQTFGTLPAILLTTTIYVSWHIGTQLVMESDPWMGALKLFGVGILYQSVFSLTYNLAIIWPFFMGMGVMIDFLINIGEIGVIAEAYPWALGTAGVMVLVMLGCGLLARSLHK